MTQVERIDAYTRQSLYILMWGTVGLVVLSRYGLVDDPGNEFVVFSAAAFLLTAVAVPVLRDIIDLYPASWPLPWRTLTPYLALAALLCVVAATRSAEIRDLVFTTVWLTAGWSLSGLCNRRFSVLLLLGLAVLAAVPAPPGAWPIALLGGFGGALFLMFTVRVSLWVLGVVTELDVARQAQSELAVAEERLRFSRDVHDVLGRRLSAIAVQSELAASLARRGDASAADRMMEVRETANASLREARALARGYRETDVQQELDGARALLQSAGIDVVLDVPELPDRWQEPAGWVVREAVTNVLRHSEANQVRIEYDEPCLRITNDGVREDVPTPKSDKGSSGLDGLRERLAALGADLRVQRDGETFSVIADLTTRRPQETS